MANITLAFDDVLLTKGRKAAKARGISFNEYLRQKVEEDTRDDENWAQELFALMDSIAKTTPHSNWKWNREEIQRDFSRFDR